MRCDNCGRSRQAGRYCPYCGQSDRDFQRALPPLLGELIQEAFEVDSRILRSMKTLLFKPGVLSLEFSRNRRADYVSPVRMYLFASLVFFFALSLTTDIGMPGVTTAEIEVPASASAGDIARLREMLAPARRDKLEDLLGRDDASIARRGVEQLAAAVVEDPPGPVGRYMVGVVVDGLHDPADMLDTLLDQLPVAMFVMLPVFAGLLKLFYVNRRRFYVEHLVFALHVHTVTFIVFTLVLLLPGSAERPLVSDAATIAGNVLLWVLVGYQYLALQGFYGGSHLVTLLRFAGLALSYLLLLLPGVIAVVLAALMLG